MNPTFFRTSLALCVIVASSALTACKPSAPSQPPSAAPAAPSAAPAPSTPDASAPAAVTAPSDLTGLQQYVGRYPSDSQPNFLEEGVLAERLRQMLGSDYATFLQNMGTVSPLTQEGTLWFLTGNRQHEGGMEEAALVIDAPRNTIKVWMLHNHKTQEWTDPSGAQLPWPADVQTMVDNQKTKP